MIRYLRWLFISILSFLTSKSTMINKFFYEDSKLICIFKFDFFQNSKLICIFRYDFFFQNSKLICIFRSDFFQNSKLICIFRFVFSQNWYVFDFFLKLICIFIKYRSFFFFWKSFICNKNADFEIQKMGLKVRLKFFLICVACIINLSHKCESSFKSHFYLFPTTNLAFHKPKIFFIIIIIIFYKQ